VTNNGGRLAELRYHATPAAGGYEPGVVTETTTHSRIGRLPVRLHCRETKPQVPGTMRRVS
jgi:hypothetical protein